MNKHLAIAVYCLGVVLLVNKVKAQSYVPELNDKRMAMKPKVEIKAYSFDLQDVHLLKSPFQEAMKKDAEVSKIPIVVVSTSDREEEISDWKSENVPMVTKPSGFTELVSCVQGIISRYLG